MERYTWSTSSRLNTAGFVSFTSAHQRTSPDHARASSSASHQPLHHLRAFSTRQRTWPQALQRMSRFAAHCEALRARRAGDARDTPRGDARRESRERDGCRNPDDATGTTSIESRIDLIRFDLI